MRTERVLVSMKKFIGDAVMTVPLIDSLETDYSGLTFITGPAVMKLLQHPTKERLFIPLESSRKFTDLLRTARDLRQKKFDRAVLINHSFRSALTLKLAGIPMRVGHVDEGRQILLTHPVRYDESLFEAWSVLELAHPMGVSDEHILPRVPLTQDEITAGRAALQGAQIGVQPGATFVGKSLPTDLLANVCRRLQRQGHRLVLFGSGEEAEIGKALQEKLDEPAVDLVGKTDIRTSLGALSNLKLVLGADTGLMHMAAAVGCPTVTIFGPTPKSKWGHQYPPHQVLQAPGGVMADIKPETILTAVEAIASPTASFSKKAL